MDLSFKLFISLLLSSMLCILCYAPLNRANHNSIVIDKRLLIFGGLKRNLTDKIKYARELFYLDLSQPFNNKNLSWNLIPEGDLPIYAFLSTAIVGLNNTTIFLIGGVLKDANGNNVTNLVYMYDYSVNKWTAPSIIGDYVSPRQAMEGVIDDSGNIYIFGGYDATLENSEHEYDGPFFNEMNMFNTTSMSWKTLSILENLPSRCGGYSANILQNGTIVYIGGGDHPLNSRRLVPININNVSKFF